MSARLRRVAVCSDARAPLFETLEPRVLLEGNVTAVAAAGSLFVTGDNLKNDIEFNQPGAGQIRIASGASATTVNGLAAQTFSVTGDVFVYFNDGDDRLFLNVVSSPRDLWVFGGPGNNTVFGNPGTVGRNLYVFNSTGDDQVGLTFGGVSGAVFIDNGPGSNVVSFASETLSGNVTVLSAGANSFTLNTVTVGGSLNHFTSFGGVMLDISTAVINGSVTFSHAGGGAAPGASDWASVVLIDPSTINGNLTVLNGAGDDYIGLDHVTLHGSLFASQGPDAAYLKVDHSTVGGSITQVRGEGGDLASNPGYASLAEFSTATVGGVTLLNGSGVDALVVNGATFNGNLFVQNGPGAAATSISIATLHGTATFLRGEGGTLPAQPGYSSILTFNSATVTQNLLVLNGSGNDAVTASIASFNGAVSVFDGPDGGYISLSSVTVDGALVFLRGSGGSLVGLGGGFSGALILNTATLSQNVTFINGTGDDAFTASSVTFNGSVLVDFGPDAASLSFTTVNVAGALTLLRGFGGELETTPGIAGSFAFNSATLGQNLLLVSGSGDEQAVFNNAVLSAGALFNFGSDALQLALNSTNVAGAMTVFRGEGGSIGSAPAYASEVSFDHSSVGGALAIFHGSGLDSVSFDHFTAQGNAGVYAGLGGIEVAVVTSAFNSSLTLGNLSGAGTFGLGTAAAVSTVAGSLSVSSGSSVDAVILRRLSVIGATSIDTGAGADTVDIDDSGFTGAFTLDTGADADAVTLERIGASVIPTAFDLLARINTGSGDDIIRMGINGDANAKAVFSLGLNLDGGPGADVFIYLTAGNIFSVAPVITSVETIV